MPVNTSTPDPRRSRYKPRGLALVTAAVLLAHWGLLHGLPLTVASFQGNAPSVTPDRPFITRTIALQTPPVPQAAAAQAPPGVPAALPNPAQASIAPPAPADTAQAATEVIANSALPAPEAAPAFEPATLLALADTAKPGARAANGAQLPQAQAAQNYAFPGSVRLKYTVKGETKGIPLTMDGELLWLQDGKTYDARMEISHFLLGSIVQTSSGQLSSRGLEPVRFADKRRSEVAAHFDRNRGKVIFSANTPDADLLPGAQDQLSVFVQLAAMLGGDPKRYPAGTEVVFQAIGSRSSESWVFKVGDTEKLALPGGEVQAVKLSRPATGTYDSSAEIWLAPDMAYLPVRIRLGQANGDTADQQWSGTQKP
jgi:hypothetical protein